MNIKTEVEVKQSKELELAVAADLEVKDPEIEEADAILNEKIKKNKKDTKEN